MKDLMNKKSAITNKYKAMSIAEAHADAIREDWCRDAYRFLVNYAETHGTFRAEQVIALAHDVEPAKLKEPPTRRAWGGIFRKAANKGILSFLNTSKAIRKTSHNGYVTLWISKIYQRGR